jgi:hypothetical protein
MQHTVSGNDEGTMYRGDSSNENPVRNEKDWRSREGQVLVMFAAGLMLLIGMVAVAIDTGFLMAERRQVQNAADAGALAAAKAKLDYMYQTGPVDLEGAQVQAGQEYASRNAGVSPDDVTVDTSPDGYGDEFVEVTVPKDVDMFFIRALYDGDWGTSASAIAGIDDVQMPYALMALRECGAAGEKGIDASGGVRIDVNEGSIMSNCNITRDGDSSFVLADGGIDAAGTVDPGTNWYAGQGFREARPVLQDPIVAGGYVPPDKDAAKAVRTVNDQASLSAAVTNLTNLSATGGRCPSGTTCVMQPGFYGGNLTLDVRGTLQLQPGVYYFGDSFLLSQQGSASLVRGTDVMIYIGDNARWRPHNGQINIAAPATSPYTGGLDGMLLWIGNGSDFNLQAGNATQLTGVVYAPNSSLSLQGSPSADIPDQRVQVIAGSLTLSGGGTFNILYEEFVPFDVPAVFLVR